MDNIHPLKRWRLRRGITVSQLAKMLGVGKVSVFRYESTAANMREPMREIRDRIVILSDGEVDGNAWLGPEALEVVAKRHAEV